jgi:hypothetical protein
MSMGFLLWVMKIFWNQVIVMLVYLMSALRTNVLYSFGVSDKVYEWHLNKANTQEPKTAYSFPPGTQMELSFPPNTLNVHQPMAVRKNGDQVPAPQVKPLALDIGFRKGGHLQRSHPGRCVEQEGISLRPQGRDSAGR